MLSNRIDQLAAPPRPVPLRVACRALLGRTGGMGAIFLLTGLLATWLFIGDIRPIAEVRLALSSETTTGTITRVERTNTTVNDVTVYRYLFAFRTPNEETFTGQSYTVGQEWSAESRVTVQYVPDKPSIARIEGSQLSAAPMWGALLVLIFPGTGAALFLSGAVSGWKQTTLLRHGEVAGAKIISEHATGVIINNVPVIAYDYEFPANDGEEYMGSSKSMPSGLVGDEAREPVLYLPRNPRMSTLVDAIPLRYPLDVDEYGQWMAREGVWPIVWYALIWAGILGSVAYALLRTLSDL
ncbi:MAG: DUF3592 domain-containing protein [Anaerolineae bacterium]|nr:DUF3592 domain-containing protein [Anaerolineae bacterium]